jgi:3-deoxy-D-manno-octulosonic-acid transferase
VLVVYNLFLKIYGLAVRAISPWNLKARFWLQGRKGLNNILADNLSSQPPGGIWMHCASLGEFEQGRPVLEAIKSHWPDRAITLTFFSPSGYEVCKNYEVADHVFYLPIDSSANAKLFLNALRPSLVIFVKYEFWHYYLKELKNREIPTILISAIFRKNQPFFRVYGAFWRNMLDCFTHLFLQDEASLSLLREIGFQDKASCAGDTRFDRVLTIANIAEDISTIHDFCAGHKVIIAGSTWLEDEETIAHYANSHAGIRFVIAPHEPGQTEIANLKQKFPGCLLYSAYKNDPSRIHEAHVLIIDTIGILSRIYRYATVAYVGGGFGGDGVHNVLEAAVFNKPVVMGPVFHKFREAVELSELGGAIPVDNALDFEKVMDSLLFDEDRCRMVGKIAGDYVREKAGATTAILDHIQEKRLLTN